MKKNLVKLKAYRFWKLRFFNVYASNKLKQSLIKKRVKTFKYIRRVKPWNFSRWLWYMLKQSFYGSFLETQFIYCIFGYLVLLSDNSSSAAEFFYPIIYFFFFFVYWRPILFFLEKKNFFFCNNFYFIFYSSLNFYKKNLNFYKSNNVKSVFDFSKLKNFRSTFDLNHKIAENFFLSFKKYFILFFRVIYYAVTSIYK